MSEATSEASLLAWSRDGDETAYAMLFERYAGEVRRYIDRWLPRRLRPRVSVSDVLQETRIVAFQRIADFEDRGPGSLRNWLLRIAELKTKAVVQHHVGTAKRALDRERSAAAAEGLVAAANPSPSQQAIARETDALVVEAMATLSPDHRLVLQLALREKLPLREVAERMGRSREAAKKLYGRALSRFTEAFDQLTGEADGR